MPNKGKFIGGQDNLYVPDAPTIGTATGDDQSLSVTFTAPSDVGNDAITAYGASATDGTNVIGATGSSSPVTVTGLTNGTSYTAQVWAINDYGNGPLSAASNSVTAALDAAYVKQGINFVIEKFNISTTGNGADFADSSFDDRGGAGFGNDVYAFWVGGGSSNVIERLTNSSGGTATDFGDMTQAGSKSCGISNNVRGMSIGGDRGSPDNFTVLEYVTMATTGNATDFGDINVAAKETYGLGKGSATRGVFGAAGDDAGSGGPTDAMSYITIASAGNAVDFGNLSVARIRGAAGNNSTRVVFSGGQIGNEVASNVMDYITIASTGNATDFGDTTQTRMNLGGASNSTRSVFTGGAATSSSGSRKNTIDYITTATTGNATDFGDLTAAMEYTTANSSSNPSQQNEAGFAPAAIGLFAGGEPSAGGTQSTIEYIDIATTGNAAMFGDLTGKRFSLGSGTGVASATRGVFLGGHSPTDTIEYVTFSTKSKATDFGNLTSNMYALGAASNSTRGLGMGGHSGSAVTNVIQYITIASTGNATDFGDLNSTSEEGMSLSSTTRAVHAIGASSGAKNTLEYVTIASTGNATDFGDLTGVKYRAATVASNTRGIVAGGLQDFYTTLNVIEYITTASTGNGTDFGDLTSARSRLSGVSSGVRGVFGSSHDVTVMDYVTIASAGNATDFGDMFLNAGYRGTASNSHGGIS